MSYQVECGECGKEILIEDLGVEVACPHCDTTLILTAEDVGEIESETAEQSSAEEEAAFDFNFSENSSAEHAENGSDSGVASAILTKDEAEAAQAESDPTESKSTHASDSTPNFDFLNQASAETSAPDSKPNLNFLQEASAKSEEAPEASNESASPPDSDMSEQSPDNEKVSSDEESAPKFDFLNRSTDQKGASDTVSESTDSEDEPSEESAVESAEEKSTTEETPNFDFLNKPSEQEDSNQTAGEMESEDKEEKTPAAEVEEIAESRAEEAAGATEETPADEVPNFNFTNTLADNETASASQEETESEVESSSEKQAEAGAGESAGSEENSSEVTASESSDSEAKSGDEESEEERPITQTASYASRSRGPSPKVFQALVSYALLITIVSFYLLYSIYQGPAHQLESLPDIAPPEEVQLRLIRENAQLAPGHTLQIGETRRYGNVELTPLRVSREKIEFEHFQGEGNGTLAATSPVLKLWLKIENVSDDQVFPPLDLQMLTLREHDPKDFDRVYANNWICKESDLSTRDNRILMFNHPPTSEFDMKGFVNRPLQPGESVETFIPTQESDLGTLDGPLVWRFQLRKGFHPQTMNGVTTLVEVKFSSDDV